MNTLEQPRRMRDTSKEPPPDPGKPKEAPGAPVDDKKKGVRCPKCRWRPKKSDLWACSCGHMWNTFDTGGCCPQCLYKWPITQCLRCKQYSNHEDWYGE